MNSCNPHIWQALLALMVGGAAFGCDRGNAEVREAALTPSGTAAPATKAAVQRAAASAAPDWRRLVDDWEYPDPIPNFALTNQDGKKFHLADLSAGYLVVGLIFTHCSNPKACPLTMDKMQQVQQLWAQRDTAGATKGRKLHLLTLTFDPENDTPEVLKSYGAKRRIDFSSWTLATGPVELMEDGLPSLFGVLALPRGKGDISHSVKLALLAPGLENVKEWDNNDFEPKDVVELALSHAAKKPSESPHR